MKNRTTETLPLMEDLIESKTVERFDRQQDRVAARIGYGDTVGALAITKECLEPLKIAIEAEMSKVVKHPTAKTSHLLRTLRGLPSETIAMTGLVGVLHGVAMGWDYLRTCVHLGNALNSECWSANLLRNNARLHARIARTASAAPTLQSRRAEAKKVAKRAGFVMKDWTKADVIYAGNWLLSGVLAACPQVITLADEGGRRFPTVTEGALGIARAACDFAIASRPAWLPMQTPPVPWTAFEGGGYGKRWRSKLVRSRHKETEAEVKAAIASGQMQPVLDAVNALQDVAWRINEPMLHIMQQCYERCIDVKGLPPLRALPPIQYPDNYADLTEDQQRALRAKAKAVRTRNRGLLGERLMLAEDFSTAQTLAGAPFWTPTNLDWRGRAYPMPHFNFQRDDRVRALFLFDEGMAIGAEGLKWLKVHVANCGDFDKVSKRPMEERVAWVDAHLEEIRAAVDHPLGRAHRWWRDADKPFLFLAACMELVAALENGPSFITRMPISFDGSCSGLQHLCAMTRAEEGALVNLTSSALPQDVYETVAQRVKARVMAETANTPLANIALTFGIDRKLVKRNVMTYSYSSKKFGMQEQLMEDTMRPLQLDVIGGKFERHPFASDLDVYVDKDGNTRPAEDGLGAARYLAGHIYAAIEETVTLPAMAMTFLQKLARALAHEGKPLRWVTPDGLPWTNRYHVQTVERVKLFLHDVAIRLNVSTGDAKEIDKGKSSNGVAPNFVHALDSTHLRMVVTACARENITQVATVHDSFGCLAPVAARFNEIIREQFVALYEQHDVLAEALASANADLLVHNGERLPELFTYGSLDLKGVLNAQYAFA